MILIVISVFFFAMEVNALSLVFPRQDNEKLSFGSGRSKTSPSSSFYF